MKNQKVEFAIMDDPETTESVGTERLLSITKEFAEEHPERFRTVLKQYLIYAIGV